jgi:hypothetical protein
VYSFWTIVKTILDKCQVSKHRSRNELRTREEELAAPPLPSIRAFRSPDIFPEGSRRVRLAATTVRPLGKQRRVKKARRKQTQIKITQGGSYDE